MVGMPRKVRSLLAAAAVIFGIAGCAGTGNVDTSVSGSLGYQQGDGNIVVYNASGRSMVGNVSGTTLQGQPLDLASLRGKYVVVNFWSERTAARATARSRRSSSCPRTSRPRACSSSVSTSATTGIRR